MEAIEDWECFLAPVRGNHRLLYEANVTLPHCSAPLQLPEKEFSRTHVLEGVSCTATLQSL